MSLNLNKQTKINMKIYVKSAIQGTNESSTSLDPKTLILVCSTIDLYYKIC